MTEKNYSPKNEDASIIERKIQGHMEYIMHSEHFKEGTETRMTHHFGCDCNYDLRDIDLSKF